MTRNQQSTNSQEIPRQEVTLEQATEALAGFAVERDDLKILLATLPDDAGLNKTTLEYEFQILKVVCTGWAISYYMVDQVARTKLGASFWEAIQSFSETISQMTSLSAGIDISYFDVLRERADIYIKAIAMDATEPDPAMVIGLVFADICGSRDQSLVVTSGRRVFNVTLAGVKNYLETIHIIDIENLQ